MQASMALRRGEMAKDDPVKKFRDGKVQIGGHFDPADILTLRKVLADEALKRGRKLNMQDALQEMISKFCKEHGVTLPSEAKNKPESV